MLQGMARNWWMLIVRGIAAVLFGIVVFVSPNIALTALVLLWGAYTLVDGIAAFMVGVQGRQGNNHWWITVLEGLVGVITGILTFLWPNITALLLLYIIAGWAIITGILKIMSAIQLRREIRGEFWLGLGGAVSLLFGVLLVVSPEAGILSLLWLLAIYSIMFGVALVLLGLRMRRITDYAGQSRVSQSA